jgi:prepilin-type N-terminal cleavage/methylation domain-containing protein
MISCAVQFRRGGCEPAIRRRGFTLVELMVVILIIGILASMFMLALARATQTAKVARTRSLVQKMHNMLMSRWDSYRTLRLPIAAEAKSGSANPAEFDAADETERYRQNIARRRMFAMRELVRMEMPDRYEDLQFNPSVLVLPGTTTPIRPYLWHTYRRRIAQAASARKFSGSVDGYMNYCAERFQSAECLYLILTSGLDDSSVATEHFSPNNLGDADGDGMPEFKDSWNNPIEFLRWAPGFVSPMQPLFRYDKSDPRAKLFHANQPTDPDDPNSIVSHWQVKIDTVMDENDRTKTKQRLVLIDQDDPFNPLRVGPKAETAVEKKWTPSKRWRPGDAPPEHGFLMIPLIYSYGLDGESGIEHGLGQNSISWAPSQGGTNGNAYLSDPYARFTGSNGQFYRGQSTDSGYDVDNITNHNTVINQ